VNLLGGKIIPKFGFHAYVDEKGEYKFNFKMNNIYKEWLLFALFYWYLF